jgi:hypothetical protein
MVSQMNPLQTIFLAMKIIIAAVVRNVIGMVKQLARVHKMQAFKLLTGMHSSSSSETL